jgi:signal recognition particle receptor subunit alpha
VIDYIHPFYLITCYELTCPLFQERTGNNSFEHNALTLKYKLDNEFELVFVVAYQKILQLSYVDKFLNDIHLEFRDKYKTDLHEGLYFQVCGIVNSATV